MHGHIFTIGVLLPLALAGALLMARRAGGREIGQRSLHWLVRGYLPAAAVRKPRISPPGNRLLWTLT